MQSGVKIGVLVGLLLLAGNSMAADAKTEYLKVAGYASMLGHAQACGREIEEELGCMESWISRTFVGEELAVEKMFVNEVKYSADQQKRGLSQKTCSEAQKAFRESKCGQRGPVMSRVPGIRRPVR